MITYRNILIQQLILVVSIICATPGLFAQQCEPPPSGLVAWWSGDTDGSDMISNGFDATLKNGAAAGATGKVWGAFEFDGVDDIADTMLVLGSKGTIEFWVKPGTLSVGHAVVGTYGKFSGWDRLYIAMSGPVGTINGYKNKLIVNVGHSSINDIMIPNPAQEGVWTHIALTFDYEAHSYLVYINGTITASSNAVRTAPTGELSFGGMRAAYPIHAVPFPGRIDELSVFNRVLSDDEIESIFQAGNAGKCDPDLYRRKVIFPQAVLGGGWQTLLSVRNSDLTHSGDISVQVYDYLGRQLQKKDLTLSAGETKRLTFTESSTVPISGYIVIERNSGIIASLRYEGRNVADDILESVGVIPNNRLLSHTGFMVDVVYDDKLNTGIALVPDMVEETESSEVVAVLYDDSGHRIDDAPISTGKHYSKFVSDIFPDLEKPFRGYMHIHHGGSYDAVHAIALLIEYRSDGWELTSLPLASR